ncbi:MAG: hypothetical protein ABIN74_12260 [Ferruginibacter sp.]
MRKLFTILITALVGCQSQTEQTNSQDSTLTSTKSTNTEIKPVDETPADISGCYMQVLKRDTFVVILKQHGNVINGRLSLDNYEKDGSTGTITGRLEAGVLKLLYSFASEGMNSIMEVYFKYTDNTLTRGIGEMGTKGDSAYFINPGSIKYNGSILTRMSCENLPDKYK